MAFCRYAVVMAIVLLGWVSPARAQNPPPPEKKQDGDVKVVVYNIRNLAEKPGVRKIVEAIFSTLDPPGERPTLADRDAVQVLNGNRLVIRATVARHAQIATLLESYNRLTELSVIVNSQLYEVDEAFFKKFKNVKRVPSEELEEQFLAGKASDTLFMHLDKQKKIQAGDEIKVRDGGHGTLLSRQRAVACRASPDQIRKGDKARQTIIEGVGFVAAIQVSPDRRYVRMKLTEKAADLEEIMKVKVWDLFIEQKGAAATKLDAEVPIVKESTHVQSLEIPDGGSAVVPVHYRPASAQTKERWWVLSITPRIYIDEEERAIREGMLADILPMLAADSLKNPRLKAARDMYGTPDDKRVALVNGDAGAWPEKLGPDLAGHALVPGERAGKRLLGIRFDKYEESSKENTPSTVTVTLINSGGSANGPAIGGCTIRYTARSTDKGWVVELAEP